MQEALEKEASTRIIPLLHHYPVSTEPEEFWEPGNVMLGFDAEARPIQKLPLSVRKHCRPWGHVRSGTTPAEWRPFPWRSIQPPDRLDDRLGSRAVKLLVSICSPDRTG